jgi:hypothetical protein
MLAESEAGVWQCTHGGHLNRSDSLCKIPTPCKPQFTPTMAGFRASGVLCGDQWTRVPPHNRRNCDSNHSLQFVPLSEFKTHRERRVLVSSMQIPTRECARTACSLACELIDKLTVIVGNCDLLRDKMEAGSPESERLDMIRGIAKEIAKELGGCQCRLLEAVRSVGGQKHYVV